MPLLLPRSAAQERAQINAEMRNQVYLAHGERWTEEVRRVDPSLEVVRTYDNASDPELKPGTWYLLKRIPGSVDAYIELPRPPGAWMYDWLTANDMWNPRVHRSKREAQEKMQAARDRARALEKEQREDEMKLAYSAAQRIRGDNGMHTRTDRKRKGEGL